jgi:hypothetical protein
MKQRPISIVFTGIHEYTYHVMPVRYIRDKDGRSGGFPLGCSSDCEVKQRGKVWFVYAEFSFPCYN